MNLASLPSTSSEPLYVRLKIALRDLIGSGLQQVFEDAYLQAADEAMRYRLAQQVKRLTLPEQMGESFQAMLLARGLDTLPLPAELLEADQGGRL